MHTVVADVRTRPSRSLGTVDEVRLDAGMLRAELACVRESDGATITTAVATLVE